MAGNSTAGNSTAGITTASATTAGSENAGSGTVRSRANRALVIVLASGVVAWACFVCTILSDVVVEAGRTPDELWGPDSVIAVRLSTYLLFASIAVFTIGGLIGRRLATRAHLAASPPAASRQVATAPGIALARAVRRFATTVAIIGLALAASAAVYVFIENFLSTPDNDTVSERVLNSYLPIVLYTSLVVAVILGAFVFTPRAPANGHGATGFGLEAAHASAPARGSAPTEVSAPTTVTAPETAPALDAAPAPETAPAHDAIPPSASPHSAAPTGIPAPPPAAEPQAAEDPAVYEPAVRRATALAYTLPIVATMVALVFGLIVYDVTGTALDAWIWVIVQALIAGGIIAGTAFAARAFRTQLRALKRPAGASVGAKNLNFVLSVVFAAVVASMALGYGASAAEQLRVQPSLSVSAYLDASSSAAVAPEDVTVSMSGYDLARGSEGVITLEPGGVVIKTETAGRDGSLWGEASLPAAIPPGEHTVAVHAESPDGRALSVEFAITVSDDGLVRVPGESYASLDDEPSRVMAPTAAWALGDLAPALVLLLLVIGTLYATLNARSRCAQAGA